VGAYRLDNISLRADPPGALGTDCTDPTAPLPNTGGPGPNLISNGSFTLGTLSWNVFGSLLVNLIAGVLDLAHPSVDAGGILQSTNTAFGAGEIITAQLDMANTGSTRKRVVVLMHDADFSDLSVCTFWLPPGSSLGKYTMRTFTTKPWANATLSIYAVTASADGSYQVDNVNMWRTSSAAITGTNCGEPVPNGPAPAPLVH
jgi:hypothetical protein